MGDKSLMKKIMLLPLTLTLMVHADLSVKQIEDMVVKIHQKRSGVELETLQTTKDPFLKPEDQNNTIVEIAPEIAEKKMLLHAIVNGKAYINDGWKNIDDTVMGYTVKFIGKSGVVLRNGNLIKKLYLKKKSDSFITLEER
jgi:hypothetical protein